MKRAGHTFKTTPEVARLLSYFLFNTIKRANHLEVPQPRCLNTKFCDIKGESRGAESERDSGQSDTIEQETKVEHPGTIGSYHNYLVKTVQQHQGCTVKFAGSQLRVWYQLNWRGSFSGTLLTGSQLRVWYQLNWRGSFSGTVH
ncbi:hypothetical protein ElyMa_000620400 [Elysia marginata]|uniref:Uncharacterized protein n=1 Tax=Elysia marginata TaxID=1093978 RepID=A0AAV4GAX8_9GAST|nr:hypothetical protein ElyMa_000620400 [Elysia marginata]